MLKPVGFLVCIFMLGLDAAGVAYSQKPWPLLTSTDKIHIVWPASAPHFTGEGNTGDRWSQALEHQILESGLGGINAHLETISFQPSQDPYYPANTVDARAKALKDLLDNPKVKAIQWGRGGYGTSDVLARLWDSGYRPKRQVPVFGFSDATAFHLYFPKIPFFHAPMAVTNTESIPYIDSAGKEASLAPMADILRGTTKEVSYTLAVYNSGRLSGVRPIKSFIRGGNAAVIFRHNGTPQQLRTDGAILFLEDDIYEKLYGFRSIFFTSVIRSGVINKNTAAVILGKMPIKNQDDVAAIRLVVELLKENKLEHIPVLYNDGFGHGDKNGILPFNTPAVIRLAKDSKTATITIKVRP